MIASVGYEHGIKELLVAASTERNEEEASENNVDDREGRQGSWESRSRRGMVQTSVRVDELNGCNDLNLSV